MLVCIMKCWILMVDFNLFILCWLLVWWDGWKILIKLLVKVGVIWGMVFIYWVVMMVIFLGDWNI